jgi:hypothetical protein
MPRSPCFQSEFPKPNNGKAARSESPERHPPLGVVCAAGLLVGIAVDSPVGQHALESVDSMLPALGVLSPREACVQLSVSVASAAIAGYLARKRLSLLAALGIASLFLLLIPLGRISSLGLQDERHWISCVTMPFATMRVHLTPLAVNIPFAAAAYFLFRPRNRANTAACQYCGYQIHKDMSNASICTECGLCPQTATRRQSGSFGTSPSPQSECGPRPEIWLAIKGGTELALRIFAISFVALFFITLAWYWPAS